MHASQFSRRTIFLGHTRVHSVKSATPTRPYARSLVLITLVMVAALACSAQAVTDQTALTFRIGVSLKQVFTPERGASIAKVIAGSPASQFGLRQGDVILFVDKIPTTTATDASTEIKKRCGQQIAFDVFRVEGLEMQQRAISVAAGSSAPCVGVELEDASIQYPATELTEVQADTPAAKMGLRPGDKLLLINSIPVFGNVPRAVELIRSHGRTYGSDKPLDLTILRGGERLAVGVPTYASSAPPVVPPGSASEQLAQTRFATLRLCNLWPFPARVDVRNIADRSGTLWGDGSISELIAGECKVFERVFQDVEPAFYFRMSTNSPVARWENDGQDLEWSNGAALKVCATNEVAAPLKSTVESCRPNEQSLNYFPVPVSFLGRDRAEFFISLSEEYLPLRSLALTDDERRKTVRTLAALLPLRMEFEQSWGKYEFPYLIGGVLEDQNAGTRGVLVRDAMASTPFGIPISIQKGDVITSFEGYPVFGLTDLKIFLKHFAETKGIYKPFKLTVIRGDAKEWELEGTFFFNERAFPRTAGEKNDAWWWGLFNQATLGFAVKGRCAGESFLARWNRTPEDPNCEWRLYQRVARLRQMYGTEYDRGGMGGMIIQMFGGLRAIKFLAQALGGSVAAEVIAGSLVGVGELATLHIREAVPGQDISQGLSDAVRTGATWGAVGGLLGRLK